VIKDGEEEGKEERKEKVKNKLKAAVLSEDRYARNLVYG